jgi:PKD repeat protein
VATLRRQSTLAAKVGQAYWVFGQFSDDRTNDGPWSWTIDWGNGTQSTGTQATYPAPNYLIARSVAYATPGTRTVTFRVTDKHGATSAAAAVQIDVVP